MLRQLFIFSLFLSSVFMAASDYSACFTQCMACLMIDSMYCPMDVSYPTGAQYCLKFCKTEERFLPGGSVYGIINALHRCRMRGGNTFSCVRKITQ